jgi:hypothetical protein
MGEIKRRLNSDNACYLFSSRVLSKNVKIKICKPIIFPVCRLRFNPQKDFLVLTSVIGWANPRATVRLEGLGQLKNSVTSSGVPEVSLRDLCMTPNQFLNILTSFYETLYVCHGNWAHLSGVLHRSLPSVYVSPYQSCERGFFHPFFV